MQQEQRAIPIVQWTREAFQVTVSGVGIMFFYQCIPNGAYPGEERHADLNDVLARIYRGAPLFSLSKHGYTVAWDQVSGTLTLIVPEYDLCAVRELADVARVMTDPRNLARNPLYLPLAFARKNRHMLQVTFPAWQE